MEESTALRYLNSKLSFPNGLMGCWEWVGRKKNTGYGLMRFNKDQLAHRISYVLHKGAIPEGLCIRHTCDNPSCCNPFHLLVGTHKENMHDAIERGRFTFAKASAILKPEDIPTIRFYLFMGETQTTIAKLYGVHTSTIGYINTGKLWKDF